MMTLFKRLFVVDVRHAYYGGTCRDFDFVVPGDTAKLLKDNGLIAKVRDGALQVWFEAGETGAALVPGTGARLRFGLKLVNRDLPNFTDFGFDASSENPLYTNESNHTVLEGPTPVRLVGQTLAHELSLATRPVTIGISNPAGLELESESITAANNRASISYDLRGHEPGQYSVQETYPGESRTFRYYCDIDMLRLGALGAVEVRVDGGFYATPAGLTIEFRARKGRLKYYVVAKNYSQADLHQLSVEDEGYQEEHRTEVHFDKVESDHFGSEDIPAALLGAGSDTRVMLFRSTTEVARQDRALKKINLTKNGDALVHDLPQPASSESDNNIIVRVAKV